MMKLGPKEVDTMRTACERCMQRFRVEGAAIVQKEMSNVVVYWARARYTKYHIYTRFYE